MNSNNILAIEDNKYEFISIGILIFCFSVSLSVFAIDIDNYYIELINIFVNSIMSFVFITLIINRVINAKEMILSPYVFFLVGSLIFFSLSPLAFYFGPDEVKNNLKFGYYYIDNYKIARTNILNIVSFIFIIISYISYNPNINFHKSHVKFDIKYIAIIFIISGGVINYFYILPYEFGIVNNPPYGFISSLVNLIDLGFCLIFYLKFSGNKCLVTKIVYLFPMHLIFMIFTFSKTSTLIPLLLAFIGIFLGNKKYKYLILGVVISLFLYFLLQPLIIHSRSEIYNRTGNISHATFSERIELVSDYITTSNVQVTNESKNGSSFERLIYTGPQAFVMNEYDNNRSVNNLKNVINLFIPRFIWPDKPSYVGPGLYLYSLVSNNDLNVYLGLSVYGDAYWSMGWGGVLIFSIFFGVLLKFLSSISYLIVLNKDYIYLPIVFLSLNMALLGVTKFIYNGIIATLPMMLFYFSIIYLMKRIIGLK